MKTKFERIKMKLDRMKMQVEKMNVYVLIFYSFYFSIPFK